MKRHRSNVLRRGFSLVELMVTVGIASVIVLAAVLSASSMFAMTHGQSRRSSAEASLALATTALDRYLANTGTGFGNSRYALRIRNNVPAGAPLSGNLPVVALGAAAAGVVAGTDVLELSWARPLRRSGAVTQVTGAGDVILASQDPLSREEFAGTATFNPPVMLLTREKDPTVNCLVNFTSATLPPRVHIGTLLDDDFAATGGNCPAALIGNNDALAYKLDDRVRMFVYQKANGTELGLYRQAMDPATGDFLDVTVAGQEPQLVAASVENLQAAPLVGLQYDNKTSVTVGGCTVNAPPAVVQPCVCSGSPAATCTVAANGALNNPAVNALIRSVTVEITVRGERRQGESRPASFDSAAGPVDNLRRAQGTISTTLYNGMMAAQ